MSKTLDLVEDITDTLDDHTEAIERMEEMIQEIKDRQALEKPPCVVYYRKFYSTDDWTLVPVKFDSLDIWLSV